MSTPDTQPYDSSLDRGWELLCLVAEKIHLGAAAALAFLGGLIKRGAEKLPWSSRLGLLAAILGALMANISITGIDSYIAWAELNPAHIAVLKDTGTLTGWSVISELMWGTGMLLVVGSLLAFHRHRITHLLLKIGAAGFVIMDLWILAFLIRIPSVLLIGDTKTFDADMRNYLWMNACAWWLPVFVGGLILLLMVMLNAVTEFYTGALPATVSTADRVLDNLRSHGEDPRYRTSSYWSTFLHVFVLIILPWLMGLRLMAPYGIPKGSGNPVAQMIEVKRIKKKPKQQFVLNPNSAIVFWHPDIDDSKIMDEVDDDTANQYQATELTGKMGKGGGKQGGWPHGMEGAKVRFIRLKYGGGDWNQQMGANADYNFLIKFHKMTGFKVAPKTEAIDILDLGRFPKHRAPPFVYITGSEGVRVSQREIKALRKYLLEEGGMLFADNGGGRFNWQFRGLMRRVLPDKKWIDIANDDVLYRQPYIFPHGAPPLWQHSGNRAIGVKHNGRWIVFYHQGDINDAWQDKGNKISEGLRTAAFKMGINIVNYAFNQYHLLHFGE